MVTQRSRFPLFLVLLLAAGLGVCVLWRDFSREVTVHETVAPGGDESGKTVESFGPVPLASATGEAAASPLPPDLRGSSEDMKWLAARMNRETEGLKVVEHADGRRSVSLEGRFHHMSAMVPGAGGKLEIRCFTDFNEMAAALPDGRRLNPPPSPIHDR